MALFHYYPDPLAQGGIVAAMPAGSLFGVLAATQLVDRIGRKKAIIISWIDLGDWINYLMCICGTFFIFLPKFFYGSYKRYYLFIF